MRPKDTYTVQDFISAGKTIQFSYSKFSYIESANGVKLPIYNVINDYLEELKNIAIQVVLTEKDSLRYMYKPKLLAHDAYGNPELDFIILAINNICNAKEFTTRKIKLIKAVELESVLQSIYRAEKPNINKFNNR